MKNREIIYKVNQNVILASISVIGDREEQQDCFGCNVREDNVIVTVCDGMGGEKGGKKASNTAVSFILEYFDKCKKEDYINLLNTMTCKADELISGLKDVRGEKLNAGSTMVTVIVDNKDLYWSSVGDSRLYILRDEDFFKVTVDHNYYEYLKEQVENSRITVDEFEKEKHKGEALISYLGVNGLPVIDHNVKPLKLLSKDRIIMMTDGLYRILDDNEIFKLLKNFVNIKDAVEAIEKKAAKMARKKNLDRDNMTLVVMEIR